MLKRRNSRWLVSLLAVVALLVCQAAAVTQARPVVAESLQTVGACHVTSGDQGDSGKAVHTSCDSAQTVGDYLKIPLAEAAVLPLALVLADTAARIAPTWPAWSLPLGGAPPPLYLVHGRLLN